MKGQQLPLSVQLRETASFESFFAGPNPAAVDALRELIDGQGSHGVLLYGAGGSGKTHLLQATVRAAHGRGLRCAYVPLAAVSGTDALEGHGDTGLLALDDVDTICADADGALALLRLLDRLRAAGARWLLSALAPPERLSLALPDLRTRLSACAIFGLKPLDDTDRQLLLRQRALGRGLELPDEVARWLLTQLPRDTASLLAALELLDRASLSAKRRLTLPFVQQTLQNAPARPGARTTPAH